MDLWNFQGDGFLMKVIVEAPVKIPDTLCDTLRSRSVTTSVRRSDARDIAKLPANREIGRRERIDRSLAATRFKSNFASSSSDVHRESHISPPETVLGENAGDTVWRCVLQTPFELNGISTSSQTRRERTSHVKHAAIVFFSLAPRLAAHRLVSPDRSLDRRSYEKALRFSSLSFFERRGDRKKSRRDRPAYAH